MPVEQLIGRNFGDSPRWIDLRLAAPHLSALCGDVGNRITITLLIINPRTSNQFLINCIS